MILRTCFLILLLFSFLSCNRNDFKVNVNDIDLEIKIKRLESDLFEPSVDSIISLIPYLENKYGHFYALFNYVINIGQSDSPYYPRYLKSFVTDSTNREVYRKTIKEYPDIHNLEKELTEAFKHYIYYFSNKKIPDIYTFISGFNASIIIDTNILGIGLDRYLGSDCEYYDRLGIPEYIQSDMHRDKIVTDCIFAFVSSEYPFNKKGERELTNNVLNNIIHEGKLIYFIKCMVPSESIGLIMGFSPEEYEFCRNNEKQMWTYLIEKKLLYSSDRMTIKKLIDKAPFTSFFPRESPGRAAVWIGYRIVRNYMDNNPDVTLDSLMINTGYQVILEESYYNPRNRNN